MHFDLLKASGYIEREVKYDFFQKKTLRVTWNEQLSDDKTTVIYVHMSFSNMLYVQEVVTHFVL